MGSTILDRLFPARKPRTSDRLAAALDATRTKLADARRRVAHAAQARAAAIASADRAGALSAKADAEAAEIDIEIAGPEIADLERALAAAVQAEREGSQAACAARLIAEGDAIERDHREWDAAVKTLARLRHRARLHNLAVDDSEFSGATLPGAVPRLLLAEGMKDFVTLDGATALPRLPEGARAKAAREVNEKLAADRQAHEEKMSAARVRSIEEGRERVRAEREFEDRTGRGPNKRPGFIATTPDEVGTAQWGPAR